MRGHPSDTMPPWFAESFKLYHDIANVLQDHEPAAAKFWSDVMKHQRFPTPQRPDLTGWTGEPEECPTCKTTLNPADFNRAWECRYCVKTYVSFDGGLEPVDEIEENNAIQAG